MNSFLEKKKLFVLLMWKLTLGKRGLKAQLLVKCIREGIP
jgi:hypothetical protein